MKKLILLVFFVVLNLICYSEKLPLRHEEPRRAIISQEMILTKNFIVPTVCQIPYFKKPPFQNWLIALTSLKDKYISNLDARIISLIFFIIMVFSVYYTSRSEIASIITLTSFSTMISYGIKAEPDIIFSCLLFLSYLFFIKDKIIISSIFMGLSILTKGISPVFFYPPVVIFGILNNENKKFYKKIFFHFFLSLILPFIWILLLKFYVNLNDFFSTSFSEVKNRTSAGLKKIILDAFIFPLRVLSATFPWSLILILGFNKIKFVKEKIFLSSFLIFSFIFFTLLILPCGKGRYFLPAVPFFAITVKDFINFEKPINIIILKLLKYLSGITFLFLGFFLLLKTQTFIQPLILILSGFLSLYAISKIKNLFQTGLILSLITLIIYVHFFKFFRSTYLYNYKIKTKIIAKILKKYNLPIVVENDYKNLKFLFNLERNLKKPVYKLKKFNSYIFISTKKIKNSKLLFSKKIKDKNLFFYLIIR